MEIMIRPMLAILCALLLAMPVGCGNSDDDDDNDDNDDTGGDTDSDTDADADGDADTDADGDADTDADGDGDEILDSSHEGWQQAGCWQADCHSDAETHYPDLDPYSCTACHGNNGAPSGHTTGTCLGCHAGGNAPPAHHAPAEDFPDPAACETCH